MKAVLAVNPQAKDLAGRHAFRSMPCETDANLDFNLGSNTAESKGSTSCDG